MLKVSVVYASVDQQIIVSLRIDRGLTIREAIQRSGILTKITKQCELGDIDDLSVGVYGKLKSLHDIVVDGDRIEIYRPLKCDPRQGRRERVEVERAQRKAQKKSVAREFHFKK